MRISFRAIIAAATAAGFLAVRAAAQDAPASPAPTAEKTSTAEPKKTTKPAATPAAKKVDLKPEPKPEPVLHPEPGVARQNNVNVRGQASINSEVIARLQKNDPITILEDITLKKPKQDEPSHWYRITLPTNVSVWVHSSFVDKASGAVKPRKLNLRGGPGENYSVVGGLVKGDVVKQIDSKGDWLKIEPSTNAFGFVAAHLVERTPGRALPGPEIVVAPKSNEVAVVPLAATNPPAITNPPVTVAEVSTATTPAVPGAPITAPVTTPPTSPPPTTATTPVVTPPPAESLTPVVEAPIEKVRKIVSREGLLKGSVSIQAPTYFELRSLDTGKTINYLFSTNLVLRQYKGLRIIVTGEEVLDERWQNTPVLVVDELQTVP